MFSDRKAWENGVYQDITKTLLSKYIENFTSKIENF